MLININELNQDHFFFCYSITLHKYFHYKHNTPYITSALHETTKNKFWLYVRTPILNKQLDEYNRFMKGDK